MNVCFNYYTYTFVEKPSFSICFDNVNQKTTVRHQTRDKRNKMFNMVQAYAALDRINSLHLSDERESITKGCLKHSTPQTVTMWNGWSGFAFSNDSTCRKNTLLSYSLLKWSLRQSEMAHTSPVLCRIHPKNRNGKFINF